MLAQAGRPEEGSGSDFGFRLWVSPEYTARRPKTKDDVLNKALALIAPLLLIAATSNAQNSGTERSISAEDYAAKKRKRNMHSLSLLAGELLDDIERAKSIKISPDNDAT